MKIKEVKMNVYETIKHCVSMIEDGNNDFPVYPEFGRCRILSGTVEGFSSGCTVTKLADGSYRVYIYRSEAQNRKLTTAYAIRAFANVLLDSLVKWTTVVPLESSDPFAFEIARKMDMFYPAQAIAKMRAEALFSPKQRIVNHQEYMNMMLRETSDISLATASIRKSYNELDHHDYLKYDLFDCHTRSSTLYAKLMAKAIYFDDAVRSYCRENEFSSKIPTELRKKLDDFEGDEYECVAYAMKVLRKAAKEARKANQ